MGYPWVRGNEIGIVPRVKSGEWKNEDRATSIAEVSLLVSSRRNEDPSMSLECRPDI